MDLSQISINKDMSEIIEGIEDIIELGNTPIKWNPIFMDDQNTLSIGFPNLIDIKSVNLENGLEIAFHEISKEVNDIFYNSAIDYYSDKDVAFDKFKTFHFVKSNSPTIEKIYDERFQTVAFKYFVNDDYEGGELYFIEFDKTVKPKAGELLIFPAEESYRYIEKPITKGIRYQVIAWQ